jgi:hypothetical protein
LIIVVLFRLGKTAPAAEKEENSDGRKGAKFMKARIFLCVMVISLALALIIPATPLFAQDKPANNMQILEQKIMADRKLLVATNMQLTESEAKAFWPIYESYLKDLAKNRSRTFNLIHEFAKNYDNMSNELAKKIMDQYMTIQADHLKLLQSYLPKLRQALPEKKVVRFYQIENKIEAVINYELATDIPLIE